jgi:hypothetical protein
MNLWLKKIKSGLAALSPTCREAVRTQSEMLDHPLPVGKRMGLWLHLLVCRWCRRYGKQIHLLHEHARENEETLTAASPQKLSTEARQRITQKLKEEK